MEALFETRVETATATKVNTRTRFARSSKSWTNDNDESSVQDKGGDCNGNKSEYKSEVCKVIEILDDDDVLTFVSSRWSAEPLCWVSDESSKIAGEKDAGEKREESENEDDAFTPWKSNDNALTGDLPTPLSALTSLESRQSLFTLPLTSASNDGKDNDYGDDVPGPQTVNDAVDAHGVVGTMAAGGDESRPSSGSFIKKCGARSFCTVA
jgi:hypothetical protein